MSGAVVTDQEFRIMHKETSFPLVLDAALLDDFGADPVFDGPQPSVTENQYIRYKGVEEVDGKWFTKYAAVDYTPEEIAARLEEWRQATTCTPFQGRMALSHAGLLSNVEALIADTATDEATKIAWEYALEWRRMSPMIASLATALNLSDEQVDNLFKDANKIVV